MAQHLVHSCLSQFDVLLQALELGTIPVFVRPPEDISFLYGKIRFCDGGSKTDQI
jgi:hypothetical protein